MKSVCLDNSLEHNSKKLCETDQGLHFVGKGMGSEKLQFERSVPRTGALDQQGTALSIVHTVSGHPVVRHFGNMFAHVDQ